MRSFFVVVFLLGCLLQPIMAKFDMDRLIHPGLAQCLHDHYVTPDDLKAATNKPVKEVDIHVMCAVKCVLLKVGIVNDQGLLNASEIMSIFADPIVKNYLFTPLSICQNMEGATTCETAFKTLLCLRQNTWSN